MSSTESFETERVDRMRHTLSHVMATALTEMYPGIQFGVGPAIKDGFYYDVDLSKVKTKNGEIAKISDTDLAKIEKKMKEIIARGFEMQYSEKSREEAIAWAKEKGQGFKVELIEELPEGETISFYQLGDFTDLCKGPHIKDAKEIGVFKLMRVAGAYWRGDENKPMLTRIYGVAFKTEAELKEYLEKI